MEMRELVAQELGLVLGSSTISTRQVSWTAE